ncbi:hypothetical protein BU15DRAFT_81128 [Melanogaster broomeanus]|nr:hypothetical protein BU15DRAFT_81128 [Melanogaster broomeanus]
MSRGSLGPPFSSRVMFSHPGLAALTFASAFKLGHYMKIPPRTMFSCQVVATIITGTVQLGAQSWMFTNIPDITQVFGTASIIWGVIGHMRQFSSGQLYYVHST